MTAIKMMIVALIVLSTAMSGTARPLAVDGDYMDSETEEYRMANPRTFNALWRFVEDYAPIARANAEHEKLVALQNNEVDEDDLYPEDDLLEEGSISSEEMSKAESSAFGFPMRRAAWRRGVRAYDPHHWITVVRRGSNPGQDDGKYLADTGAVFNSTPKKDA